MWTKLQVPSRELKLPSTWIKQTTFSLPGQYGFTGSRSFSQGQGQNPASTAPVPSDWTSIQFPHPQKSTIHKIHKWNLPNRRVSPVTLNSFNWGHSSWRSINVEFFLGVCLVRPWSASTAWLGNLTCPLYPTRKKKKNSENQGRWMSLWVLGRVYAWGWDSTSTRRDVSDSHLIGRVEIFQVSLRISFQSQVYAVTRGCVRLLFRGVALAPRGSGDGFLSCLWWDDGNGVKTCEEPFTCNETERCSYSSGGRQLIEVLESSTC